MLLRRQQNLCLVLWMACCAAKFAAAKECSHTPPDCSDETCVKRWECSDKASCGETDGCKCPPCYRGDACDEYDDGNPMVLEKSSDEITIREDHSGVVYSIRASDADQSDICHDVPPENFRTNCPCGGVEYGSLTLLRPEATQNPFSLDPETGEIKKRAETIMEAGESYYLQATIRPYKTLKEVTPLIMNLTVTVTPVVSAVEGDKTESAFLHHNDFYGPQPEPADGPKKLSRQKRDTKGSGAAASNMSLTVVGTDPSGDLLPGQSIAYELTIIVPQLDPDPMDLLVEIFVMDAVSGITPFALCNVEITEFGSLITDANGNALTKDSFVPTLQANSFLSSVNDRATINFGELKNTAAVGGTDYTDSTIKIIFDASLISNPDYVNDTAIVTAGAEYDADNYVWVSQASYTFNMASTYSYPSKIDINGPDVGAPYQGTTFNITAVITDPSGPLIFEVYTPNKLHNKFTVSNLAVIDVGANMQCTGVPNPEYEFFYSVDKRTYHRGVAKFDFVMTGLEYPDLVQELQDMGNKIELAFTVFFVDAVKDEIVSIGAGITIGTSTLWTSLINVTMGDPISAPDNLATPTYSVSNVGSNREVAANGILTYALSINLGGGGGKLIECSATPPDSQKIAGIMWGNSGGNIALMPNLTEGMTWDATKGVTAWQFYLNSTGQIQGSGEENTAVLEVSVQYLTGDVTDLSIVCGGETLALTGAVSGTAGTADMTGTADAVYPDDNSWYQGGQQALLVKLNFPPGGAAYSDMIIETSGDFDVTDFGAKICKLEIMNAGRGVPTMGGNMDHLNSLVTVSKVSATSFFEDGAQMAVGPIAGVDRGSMTATGDNDVIIRLTYIFPKNQTITSGVIYNVSLGIQLDSNLIWTGWSGFNTDVGPPATGATLLAMVTPPIDTALEIGRPTLVKFHFKMAPGSVDTISIDVNPTGGSATIFVCRILILAIGSSYPCVDPDPYGKEKTNLAQPNTIIHDSTDWGAQVTADFGVLRNVGYQEFFSDEIADSDAIEIGVIVKGVALGTDTLNIVLKGIGGDVPHTVDFTVDKELVPAETLLSAEWVPADGTDQAYEGVMKIVDLILAVPVNYAQPLKVVVRNKNPTQMKLCFAAVAAAGKNLPCVLPHTIIPEVVETDTLEEHTLDIVTCYYDIEPDNLNESMITIRTGVQLTSTSDTGSLEAEITPDTGPASSPLIYSVTKSGPLDPASINTTTEGFEVTLVDNTTTDVHPGLSMFYGVNIIIPPDTTGLVEVGAMAPTDGGRAYATLHSVRWLNDSGKNIGCLMDMENYDIRLLQNSSLSEPMIHESQTDTLVADLGFITNTGLSYMQNFPTEPDDNALGLEVEIMMADHVNATDGSVIPVSIAIKFGGVIYVVTKNLRLVRDPALDLMVLRTEFNYTTSTDASTIFKKDDQIAMTFRVSHVMNESREELNDAIVRVLLPQPLQFVDASDTQVCNITNNFTNNHYLDFDITNLFFTDYLEMNITVTVDPNDDMVKGLGVIDAAALVRLVCTTFADAASPKYCGTTSVLPFQIEGTECYDPLGLGNMTTCQFSASTAIDEAVGPDKAMPGSSGGWSPAVRSGPGWEHSITIDFLKKTRVTKIEFSPTDGKQVTQFKVSYSFNGISFVSPCDVTISVDATLNVADLPSECRFEARYGRLTIADATDAGNAFKVNFKEWYGCPMESVDDTCTPLETSYTNVESWRQISEDTVNGVFYFCDYNPKKKRTVCFSSTDGSAWNPLPSYIGSLVGESGGLFYARDSLGRATVSSTDGINWTVTDSATAAALTPTAKSVPGKASGFADVVEGSYAADYDGIKKGGTHIVKWESCCS